MKRLRDSRARSWPLCRFQRSPSSPLRVTVSMKGRTAGVFGWSGCPLEGPLCSGEFHESDGNWFTVWSTVLMFVRERVGVPSQQCQKGRRRRVLAVCSRLFERCPCLLHDQIGRDLRAMSTGLYLFLNGCLNVRFCKVFSADSPRRFFAVAGPQRRSRRVEVD